MNQQKDTGGSAFPTSFSKDYPTELVGGMTLRDYFAAKAMQSAYGLLERLDQFEVCAKHAYQMADTMLAERKKK